MTFGQAGKLTGNLTPQCTAALLAVLDALGKKTGPEDTRTVWQRRHDAVEEMCRRLIAAGGVPDRAGQPAQIQVHMTLDQLRGLTEPGAQAGWAAAWPPAGPGADCDASIVPVVTGHLDHQLLGQLAAELLRRQPGQPGSGLAGQGGSGQGGPDAGSGRWLRAERAARQLIITRAVGLLSGPGGLAGYLRTRLPDDLVASVSLPLDIGAVTDTIPVHLRRAVTVRDRHCRFPGCTQPAPACQPHHIIPRVPGRPDQPDQPDQPVFVPPFGGDSPVGLGHRPPPRRQRHRYQPRRPDPAHPQPPSHRRLTGPGGPGSGSCAGQRRRTAEGGGALGPVRTPPPPAGDGLAAVTAAISLIPRRLISRWLISRWASFSAGDSNSSTVASPPGAETSVLRPGRAVWSRNSPSPDRAAPPGRHGAMADGDVEGGPGEQAGRVEGGQRGVAGPYQQRDLGAH